VQVANVLTNTTDGQSLGVAIKNDATGSEGTLAISCNQDTIIGGIVAFSGRDNTTPQDFVAQTATATDNATPYVVTRTATPVTNGDDIFAVCGWDVSSSVNGTFTFSTTSGTTGAWTTRQDQQDTFRNVGMGTAAQVTAGAITVQASVAGSGNSQLAIVVMALKPAAASGSTGTLAVTNAVDTSAAAGTTTVVGTLARTNAADTRSSAGTTTILGTLARTNAADTRAASGTTTVLGTLARSNAVDTLAASGSVGSAVSGTLARTNANDAGVAAGTTTVVGSVATTNAKDSISASGSGGTAPAASPAVTGGTGKAGKPKRWWRVRDALYYATEDQLPRIVEPEPGQPKAKKQAKKAKVQAIQAIEAALPDVDFEIVWPKFYREAPKAIDPAVLMAVVMARLAELDEEDIEILLLH
jgi:hypothetical protein